MHGAYFGTIMLRELRGGLHIAAVRSAHLDPAASCYLDDPALFALHGYSEADAPVVSAELEDQRARAETSTTEAVAECLGVLGDVERRSLAEGTLAMFAALAEPVAVAP